MGTTQADSGRAAEGTGRVSGNGTTIGRSLTGPAAEPNR
jgi:hypothetical protein